MPWTQFAVPNSDQGTQYAPRRGRPFLVDMAVPEGRVVASPRKGKRERQHGQSPCFLPFFAAPIHLTIVTRSFGSAGNPPAAETAAMSLGRAATRSSVVGNSNPSGRVTRRSAAPRSHAMRRRRPDVHRTLFHPGHLSLEQVEYSSVVWVGIGSLAAGSGPLP